MKSILASCCLVSAAFAVNPALQKYAISDVTVSGISSGGFMAVQMHMAYSSVINGSAVFAGGPFYCAESNLMYAEFRCMDVTMGEPNTVQLVSLTNTYATQKKIDPVKNLKDDRVYIFSGKDDSVVDQAVVKSLESYYSYFVDVTNIVADYNVAAEHCLPTLDFGETCTRLSSPYIGKCAFDGAGNAFETLYGTLKTAVTAKPANLMKFSQTGYFTGKATSIGDTGYIYVPTACADGKTTCRLHISFHGCEQTLDDIDNQYADKTGFNTWAEANNIIVLYPYAKKSMSMPSNPNGCWDWWAYTDKNYGTQDGVQMKFVRDMITDLTGF